MTRGAAHAVFAATTSPDWARGASPLSPGSSSSETGRRGLGCEEKVRQRSGRAPSSRREVLEGAIERDPTRPHAPRESVLQAEAHQQVGPPKAPGVPAGRRAHRVLGITPTSPASAARDILDLMMLRAEAVVVVREGEVEGLQKREESQPERETAAEEGFRAPRHRALRSSAQYHRRSSRRGAYRKTRCESTGDRDPPLSTTRGSSTRAFCKTCAGRARPAPWSSACPDSGHCRAARAWPGHRACCAGTACPARPGRARSRPARWCARS